MNRYFRLPLDFLLRARTLDLVLPFLPERLGLRFGGCGASEELRGVFAPLEILLFLLRVL
jgi:hypothetical protein